MYFFIFTSSIWFYILTQSQNKPLDNFKRSESAVIYKVVSITIDVKCLYAKEYSGIETGGIKIVGDNFEADTVNNGKFSFNLVQFKDGNFTDEIEPGESSKLGTELYFQMLMTSPIPELVFSLKGKLWPQVYVHIFLDCTVFDDASNNSYPIIENHCLDLAIGFSKETQHDGTLQTGASFSYEAFKFVQDSTGLMQHIECSVFDFLIILF